eukprot:jgi/Galph1/3118/GphlegSOOS_G1803.1
MPTANIRKHQQENLYNKEERIRKLVGTPLQRWLEKKQLANGIERDEQRLRQRQKQIDNGKNTIGYERYCMLVKRDERRLQHPFTPLKYQKCSKRSWDGQIRRWRRMLHQYDPPTQDHPDVINLLNSLQNTFQGIDAIENDDSMRTRNIADSQQVTARSIFDDFEGN